MNVPLVRTQLRSAEMLDAVRIHRQGGWPVVFYLNVVITRATIFTIFAV